MTASDRTPVGSPSSDPPRDSDSTLPRTYVRTDGDELVTGRDHLSERNAQEPKELIALDPDDLHFVVAYDLDRESRMKHHTHGDRCLDRPSLRPGRRIPILGGIQWNYFRTVEGDWGFMASRDGLPTRYYLSLGHLTVWVGPW